MAISFQAPERGEVDAAGSATAPAHEQVYQDLRARILFGELAPGQQVTIQGLADVLGSGMTPVREAIRRLISDGALDFRDNRRVAVPVLSHSDLEQIGFARNALETELTRRAAVRIGPEVLLRLEDADARLDRAIAAGDVAGYLRLNYRFHALLYMQARAPVIAAMADRLWLRFGPSLRVVCGRFGTQNLPDRHKELLVALRAGDVDAAAEAMAGDVAQGLGQVAAVLDRDG